MSNFFNEDTVKKFDSHFFGGCIDYSISPRDDYFMRGGPLDGNHALELIFGVKQRSMDELMSVLGDLSDSKSQNYGQHWTRDEVASLTSNPESCNTITAFLEAHGASVTYKTLDCEFIAATATVHVWETMLLSEFYNTEVTQRSGRVEKVVRSKLYFIPKELKGHVETVLNIIDLPLEHASFRSTLKHMPGNQRRKISDPSTENYLTPNKIRAYYNMTDSKGSNASSQVAYGTFNESLSVTDLNVFLRDQNNPVLPAQEVHFDNGRVIKSRSHITHKCHRAALDVGYMMGLSPLSPTTYSHSGGGLIQWLIDIANNPTPPLVISFTYGISEKDISPSVAQLFTTAAAKLGCMGVTIFAMSGDNGAHSNKMSQCGYDALFPASSDLVTAVGATSVSHTLSITSCVS